MEIQFFLDKKDSASSSDLLGEIRLSDGQNTISEKLTYIDSWLEALEKGAKSLRHKNTATIDLIEEPEPLMFEKRDDYIKLSYGDMFIFVNTVDQIYSSVEIALKQINETSR
jgi:hypothetical protein